VGNFIKKVDEFFEMFIGDEMGRGFFLHLPFWGVIIFFLWNLTEALGLYLIWIVVVFGLIPFFSALGFQAIYDMDKYSESQIKPRIALGIYVTAVLTLIGIPGLYFGLIIKGVQTSMFSDSYWEVINTWWNFFNFYHKYSLKEAQAFVNRYVFHYQSWQISFLISAVVIAPMIFWSLHKDEKEQVRIDELNSRRLNNEAAEKIKQEAIKQKEYEVWQLKVKQERYREEQAEIERQRKIQEKIKEVKGKDPWGSGFL